MAASLETNKILAAVLTAGIFASGAGVVSRILYHPTAPEEPAYVIEVAASSEEDGGAAPAEEQDIGTLLASADAAAGEVAAKKCSTCHTFEEGGANKVGPNLHGVVGRAVAAASGFSYSDAMAGHGGTWDDDALNQFLANPKGYVPGTKMAFAGVKDGQDRADLIMYLRAQSPDAPPMPEAAASSQEADGAETEAEDGAQAEATSAESTDEAAAAPAEESDDAASTMADGAEEAVAGAVDDGAAAVADAADTAGDEMADAADAAAGAAESAEEQAADATAAVTEEAADAAEGVVEEAADAAKTVSEGASEAADQAAATASNAAASAAEGAKEAASAVAGAADATVAAVTDTADTAEDAADAATGGADGGGLMAAIGDGDVAAGEKISKKCKACHVFDEGGKNRLGPALWDVVGRDVASHEGFNYSAALTEFGGAWTYERLNEFLTAPKTYVPGTKMVFAGVKKDQDRADLLAYLRTLSNDPEPLADGS